MTGAEYRAGYIAGYEAGIKDSRGAFSCGLSYLDYLLAHKAEAATETETAEGQGNREKRKGLHIIQGGGCVSE